MRLTSLIFLLSLMQSPMGFAQQTGTITIVLDDMGNSLNDFQALSLPKEIVFSVLPYTPQAQLLAEKAHQQEREILLHVPMQAKADNDMLGKGALMLDMQEKEFKETLNRALRTLPYVQGVNNHMGSSLTEQLQPMSWVMEVLHTQGLYFLDSRTTAQTIAESTAKISGIPALRRHVFLDNVKTQQAMEKQLQSAVQLSRNKQSVVIIAHPYPETIKFLQKRFKTPEHGLHLITLNQLIPETQRLAMQRKKSEFQQANNQAVTSPSIQIH
ncbi:divergent polysaccharide deacetylase family protein [Psychromonas ossibalaenae]|uniref:divergent polysaccharide deacetylase family protein n=1 Tax=Psychromonas ossibalaenae TaxID=444922 RepID=UPI0003605B1F|nr:divergent polysaccharide deacetylase family protein [Psychromonas ossibalaenae]